ncbi:FliG C-terminal domain-containing protein [Acetonema longum]|uniref:Flagellar motor switch protein G n=1 Tax=Acetonema longum DSM 6540 TaxID=1009370 RepID=F7NJR4_9FIRM|nr:FliG C-terminal domain-containing protein [Acetonema longum]EGO63720.1 flagellar motor switch protein G [Acetonema longum DSM 6540]
MNYTPTGIDTTKNIRPAGHEPELAKQIIALLLACSDAQGAASLLSSLPGQAQPEIILWLLQAQKNPPALISLLGSAFGAETAAATQSLVHCQPETVARILQGIQPEAVKDILQSLHKLDPDLASQLEDRLFFFEDLNRIQDLELQAILRKLDLSKFPLALTGAGEELKNKILKNISTRSGQHLLEECEYLSDKEIDPKEVWETRRRIMNAIQDLSDAGEIRLPRRRHVSLIKPEDYASVPEETRKIVTRPVNVLQMLDDALLQEVFDSLPAQDIFRALLWVSQDLKTRCFSLLGNRWYDLTEEENSYLANPNLSAKEVEASVHKLSETVKQVHGRKLSS